MITYIKLTSALKFEAFLSQLDIFWWLMYISEYLAQQFLNYFGTISFLKMEPRIFSGAIFKFVFWSGMKSGAVHRQPERGVAGRRAAAHIFVGNFCEAKRR